MKSVVIFLAAILVILVAIWLLRIYTNGNEISDSSITRTVEIANMRFTPSDITINIGDTVKFINNDKVDHTVSEDNGSFNSGNIPPGQVYARTFTEIGNIFYHCSIHPNTRGIIRIR